ncbi:signal peptidase I SipW [Aneurinibacillus sp. REN35]|uniref:signal peptidase I SipW n=1 Tax=Aneurinibacillus sp. REN35 TaxID=3237286 RepID=UPI0035296C7D
MTIKKWISTSITILLMLILLVLAYFTVSSKLLGNKPTIFGYEVLNVLSGSMEPTFQTGSIIAVTSITNPSTLRAGDIITFVNEQEQKVTHRIKEVLGSGNTLQFITKGDNNKTQDPEPIIAANVVAKYENITVPYLGYVFTYASSKAGILLLTVVPGAFIILYQVFDMWKLLSRLEDEKEKKDATIKI